MKRIEIVRWLVWATVVVLAAACAREEEASTGAATAGPARGVNAAGLVPGDGPAAEAPAATLPAENALPEPPRTMRAEVIQTAPDEFVVEGPLGEPFACGDCNCADDGCTCGQLRSGGCLCVTIEGGQDCSCTCRGLPSVLREVNVGASGSPVSGPSMEAP